MIQELFEPTANKVPAAPDPRPLLNELLIQQADLTAVETFNRAHERHEITESRYRRLLPATAPSPGQQYAFEVDLDKCSGCKACVTACHSLNGLDEEETWRGVGLLVSPVSTSPAPPHSHHHHVTTACHHCVDPGCLSGCPVLAYDKDPITGIVRHLDDQCIGCQYCVMKCPYEAPKYSERLGIVRKCDMCAHRLAVGEAPACAQACPNEAIKITVVDQEAVRALYRGNVQRPTSNVLHPTNSALDVERWTFNVGRSPAPSSSNPFLPDSPNPGTLLPTTRYHSANPAMANLVAADHAAPRLEQAHWPLVIMLVLTQAAAGLAVVAAGLILAGASPLPRLLPATVLVTLVAGLTAAVFHLGQPLKAWRSFLGWRTSWLSRELIAFQAFAAAALLTVVQPQLILLAAVFGIVAVATSAMVYVDTHRPFWRARISFGNFFGTTLLLGSTVGAVLFGWLGRFEIAQPCALAALFIRTALFIWRRTALHSARRNAQDPIHLNARAIHELIPWTQRVNAALFVASTAFGLLAITNVAIVAPWWATLAAATTFSSEIIARLVFFVAGATKRMPGSL